MVKVRNFEHLTVPDQPSIVLRQSFSQWSGRLRALALVIAGLLVCTPLVLIALNDAALTELGRLAATNPPSLATYLILATLGIAAMTGGTYRLIKPALRRRIIKIDDSRVTVFEHAGRATKVWREPVDAYLGIRHRVVTTSSGAFHTLALEHPHPARSLLIAYQSHLADDAIKAVAQRHRLPILSSSRSEDRVGLLEKLAARLLRAATPRLPEAASGV